MSEIGGIEKKLIEINGQLVDAMGQKEISLNNIEILDKNIQAYRHSISVLSDLLPKPEPKKEDGPE